MIDNEKRMMAAITGWFRDNRPGLVIFLSEDLISSSPIGGSETLFLATLTFKFAEMNESIDLKVDLKTGVATLDTSRYLPYRES